MGREVSHGRGETVNPFKRELYSTLEDWFQLLEQWAGRMRERFAYCPDCGRNRYTGEPCATREMEVTPEEISIAGH